jgi:hypothetical protein
MRNLLLSGAVVLGLSGCTDAQNAAVETAFGTPAGQLFCSVQSTSGPLVFALLNASKNGSAVIATGAAQAIVNAECAAAIVPGAVGTPIPVSPPVSPAAAPRIAAAVPVAAKPPV